MARLALLLVVCALGVLCECSGEKEKIEDVDESVEESQERSEITNYDDAAEELAERRRREVPKTENSSRFILSEKANKEEHFIWRDNSETRKQGHVPTVTKVLYHGIYPSLNVTVPLNASYAGKYRQKREASENPRGETTGIPRLSTATTGTVITVEPQGNQPTGRREESKTRSTNGNTAEATRQYTPEIRTAYPIPTYRPTRPVPEGNHYQRAHHPNSRQDRYYLPQSEPSGPNNYAQGSIKYRTKYLPASDTYQGDPENKGRVKLISVGYYSINESTAGLRSYRNPNVDRARTKRDTHWAWLDRFFKSLWVMSNPERDQENTIPSTEPLQSEETVVDKGTQDVYGYSSNGHSPPHNVDRIYLVQNERIQNPNELAKADPNDRAAKQSTPPTQLTDTSTERKMQTDTENESMPLPADQPVLIQAPPRRIACQPPKRLARGRCRTVW